MSLNFRNTRTVWFTNRLAAKSMQLLPPPYNPQPLADENSASFSCDTKFARLMFKSCGKAFKIDVRANVEFLLFSNSKYAFSK